MIGGRARKRQWVRSTSYIIQLLCVCVYNTRYTCLEHMLLWKYLIILLYLPDLLILGLVCVFLRLYCNALSYLSHFMCLELCLEL